VSAGARHPGDIDEGPLPEIPQRDVGASLTPEERAELLEIREARRIDAARAAEQARTGDTGNVL
jgi:hypothetical protein